MPSKASTSWYACRCRGSLLASTPSKSKTIAFSPTLRIRLLEFLAGVDRHFQAVFDGRDRTLVGRVVVAVRVVGAVEIDLVDAGRRAIEIHVAPAGIRFGAARHVVERD